MKTLTTILTTLIISTASAQNTFVHKTETAEIIMLSEGQRNGKMDILIGATPEMIAGLAPNNTYPSATNAFLIRTKSGKNVLIDTGFGQELFNNLEKTGISPESIDAILLTHLHGDHTGGLLRNGKKAFPNAKLMMSKLEAESANENTLETIKQYELITFEPNENTLTPVFDDIKAMASYGHTPGHVSYFIDNVAIWGDLTHAMVFQMPFPKVAVTYDSDSAMAIASRLKMLEYLVANDYIAGGMHIAYPGIGTLKSNGKGGYIFTPLK